MAMAGHMDHERNGDAAVCTRAVKSGVLTAFRVLCGLCVLYAGAASGAPPPRTMYENTLAREQKLRAALAATDAPATLVADVRAIVAAYETLVRLYPASGYSDNALWQAGRLELDAFARFGDATDRENGVRLLRRLAAGYPSSSLAPQVPQTLAALAATKREATRTSDAPRPQSPAPQKLDAANPPPSPREAAADHKIAAAGLASAPARTGRIATIKSIRRSVLPDAVRITIELDGEVPFHDERISDPVRVFVDLAGTRAAASLVDQTLRFSADADVVRQVRIGRHPNSTTRVVLDAVGVTSYSVYPLYGPYRLVIDCVRPLMAAATGGTLATAPSAAPAPPSVTTRPAPAVKSAPAPPSASATSSAAAAVAPPTAVAPALTPARSSPPPLPPLLTAHTLTKTWPRRLPASRPRASALLAAAHAAIESAPPAPPAKPESAGASQDPAYSVASVAEESIVSAPLEPPEKNGNGGLSIARQLGLGVSRIVIDAGHGGHDPGAQGKGVTEAELVLDVAVRLEKMLRKVPGVETILTRRDDQYIPLPERTAMANRAGADLFLSIHANASPNPQAHGVETYFLNFANNGSAAAVAARENAASTLGMGEMPDIVKAIATSNKLDESRDFATHVQRAMAERLRTQNKMLKDLGVKQAPFVVLIGATMPAVLAEISFVTNPQEAKLLKSGAYRQKIAESLFNAIRKYQTSLKAAPAVALQEEG
jgi:N-acetylmuramoyl-L-alanine amidase